MRLALLFGVIIIAIQKPFNVSLRGQTLDGAESNTITWQVSGSTSTAYSIQILKNSDNTVAYTYPKTSSYAISHTLPANTLANGNEYKISVTVWDISNTTASSDYDVFQTSSRPTVSVTSIGTVSNSSNTFSATYGQLESVAIKSWSCYLYDNTQNVLAQSDIQTSTSLSYLFSGLQTGNSYYIEFQATSIKGLIGTSGKVSFNVQYSAPNLNVNIAAENTKDAGVKLTWNVSQILGHSDSSTYIGGEKLDVRNGKSVVYDSGFNIDNDFTLKTWIEGISNYQLSANTQIIVSAVPPPNINALWLEDSKQTTPKYINVSVRNIAPTNSNDLWIADSNQSIERVIGLFIDVNQPPNANAIWLNRADQRTATGLLSMDGDNGTLALEHYNSTFYLASYGLNNVRTEITSSSVTGTQFYVYIQQIADSYTLGIQALA